MSNFKVMVTLITACQSVGQGFVGTGKSFEWDVEPEGITVQATFTRINADKFKIVEVVTISGDDWREYEDKGAQESLLKAVAKGRSIASALSWCSSIQG